MSPDLIGVLTASIGVGVLSLGLTFARTLFWAYLGAVLFAGGLLIIAFS